MRIARRYASGQPVRHPPASLILYALLQKLPGYTASTLLAEDHEMVSDWLVYMRAEDDEAERQMKKLSRSK